MGNCCINSYEKDNKILIERLIDKEEKLHQSIMEANIYKTQLILTKAYYRNIEYNNG